MDDECVATLASALVEALNVRFGDADDETGAAAMRSMMRPRADEEAVFAFLQADWEREEVMKLRLALAGRAEASAEGAGGVEAEEGTNAMLAREYVAGLQEVYMSRTSTADAVVDEDAAHATTEDTVTTSSSVTAAAATISGASAVEAPPRFASRLLNDRVFRARVSGRTALANDFVGAGTLLSRAAELLNAREEAQLVTEPCVRALMDCWRSSSYLMSTPRLHRADVARMCETSARKTMSLEQRRAGPGGAGDADATVSAHTGVSDEQKQSLLRKVRRKVASSERREEDARRRASRDTACAAAEKRLRELVLHTVRVDVERYEALYKSRSGGPPTSATPAPACGDGDDTGKKKPRHVLLSDVPMPSLVTLFQAKDPDCCGWMSFSHAMLALEEAQLLITPSEMFILVSSLVKDSERNGALPWPQFLEMIGASKPVVGGDWSQKSFLDTFQAWEVAVQARLLELQGFCGPDDVAKLMLCQPSVTAQFTKTHMRRYSVALSQHPVLQSPLFMRLASSMREKHETLATVLRAFDIDLRLAVSNADVKYAFQCVGVKLRGEMLEKLCEVFRFPEGQSGREDDMYATGCVNAKFGVTVPDVDCERMLLSISPGLAILHQDKERDGIHSALFTKTDDAGNFAEGARFDIDAILAQISAAVYDKLLELRAGVLELPTPRKVRFSEFADLCRAYDIEIDARDEQLLLDFCHSDAREDFIDATRFVTILATATTPDSVSYQAPPMQIIFEKT